MSTTCDGPDSLFKSLLAQWRSPAAAEAAEDEHGAGLLQHTCKTTTPSGEITSHVAPWTQHAWNFNLLFSFHSTFPPKKDINIDITQNTIVIYF